METWLEVRVGNTKTGSIRLHCDMEVSDRRDMKFLLTALRTKYY